MTKLLLFAVILTLAFCWLIFGLKTDSLNESITRRAQLKSELDLPLGTESSALAEILREPHSPVGEDLYGNGIFIVVVQNSKMAPVVDATILVYSNTTLLESVKTDSAGKASFPRSKVGTHILVQAPNFFPLLRKVDSVEYGVVFTLNDSQRICGEVSLPNQPGESLPSTLRIHTESDLVSDLLSAYSTMEVSVNPDGDFCLFGIPADWTGRILLPNNFSLCDYSGPGVVDNLKRVVKDLSAGDYVALALTPLPMVNGLFLASDGVTPAGEVDFRVRFPEDDDLDGLMFGRTNPDGRYSVPIPFTPEIQKIICDDQALLRPSFAEIQVENPIQVVMTKTIVPVSGNQFNWTLPDIILPQETEILVKALDQGGAPIQGASIVGDTSGTITGSNGELSIFIIEFDASIIVQAEGYASAPLGLPLIVDGRSNEVILSPAGILHVSLEVTNEFDLGSSMIRLSSEQPFQEHTGSLVSSPKLSQTGLKRTGRGVVGSGFQLEMDSFEIDFKGVVPGVPFVIQVVDPLGEVVADSGTVQLSGAGITYVRLEISSASRDLFGKVIDSYGNPIGGAEIELNIPPLGIQFALTAKDGTFEVTGLSSSSIRLRISKVGFAPEYFADFAISAFSTIETFILTEGRDVEISLNGSDGSSIESAILFYGWPNGGVFSEDLGSGVYLLNGLPRKSITLTWTIGGVQGDVQIPRDVEAFQIILPEFSTVSLLVIRPLNMPQEIFLVEFLSEAELGTLLVIPDGEDPSRSFVMDAASTEKEVVFQFQPVEEYFIRISGWGQGGNFSVLPLSTTGPFEPTFGTSIEHHRIELNY